MGLGCQPRKQTTNKCDSRKHNHLGHRQSRELRAWSRVGTVQALKSSITRTATKPTDSIAGAIVRARDLLGTVRTRAARITETKTHTAGALVVAGVGASCFLGTELARETRITMALRVKESSLVVALGAFVSLGKDANSFALSWLESSPRWKRGLGVGRTVLATELMLVLALVGVNQRLHCCLHLKERGGGSMASMGMSMMGSGKWGGAIFAREPSVTFAGVIGHALTVSGASIGTVCGDISRVGAGGRRSHRIEA